MQLSSINAKNKLYSDQNIVKSTDYSKIQSRIKQSDALNVNEMTDATGESTEQAYQIATNKLNEFMEHTNRSSKFVFHKDLERYYVEVVDTKTDEVIKEVPPKELLDAYYEMQKLAGKIFDTQA